MNTLEKVQDKYANINVTPLDVAGFRLFLRHYIYPLYIQSIQEKLIHKYQCNVELYGNTFVLLTNRKIYTYTDIVDFFRNYLYNITSKILYEINYTENLTKQQKAAYKRILMEIPISRCNCEYLLNISCTPASISIML